MSGENLSAASVTSPRVNYDDLELDDQLALLDGVPFTGIVYSERPDGTIESEGQYRDGLPDGVQQEWYAGGQLERRWIAVRGNGPSEERTWHRNGQPRSTKRYENRRVVDARAWDETGRPIDPAALKADNAFGEAVAASIA